MPSICDDGLEIISRRNSLFETGPHYSCEKIFNHIPNDIKKNVPITIFKRKLRSYRTEKCYYNLDEFSIIVGQNKSSAYSTLTGKCKQHSKV